MVRELPPDRPWSRRTVLALIAALALGGCRPTRDAGSLALVDDAGYRTTLAHPATRIVSLVPATTELVFALGGGSTLVGRTRWCDYPAEAAAVPSVGDGINPSVEAVAARKPDLVLAYRSGTNSAAVRQLRALGIPVLELQVDRWADFGRAARLVAAALGRASVGDSLVADTERRLEAATVHPTNRPSVFILAWDQPPMTLGAGSFLSEIIDRAGGRNAFDSEPKSSFVVSIEAVAARNPDRILVVGTNDPAFAQRPEWQPVRAVRDRRFVRVEGSMFNRPSPRMPDAVTTLARTLGATP